MAELRYSVVPYSFQVDRMRYSGIHEVFRWVNYGIGLVIKCVSRFTCSLKFTLVNFY